MPHRIIFITLIFVVTISPSLCRRERSEVEKDLRNLCSQIDQSNAMKEVGLSFKRCWDIMKPEVSQFHDTDPKTMIGVIIDLARRRGDEIHKQFNQYYKDSTDEFFKKKYLLCSKNYNEATRNLKLASINLESNDYQNIRIKIDDTIQERDECWNEFDYDSFDPVYIRDKEIEFRIYVNIVKVVTDRLLNQD